MGELEGLIAQMEDLVRDKGAAEAAAEDARGRADTLAAQLEATRAEAGEAVRAAQTECEQLQAEVPSRYPLIPMHIWLWPDVDCIVKPDHLIG